MTRIEPRADHTPADTHWHRVGADPDSLSGHPTRGTHRVHATRVTAVPAGHIPPGAQLTRDGGNIIVLGGQSMNSTQSMHATKDPHSLASHRTSDSHTPRAGEHSTSRSASWLTTTKDPAPTGNPSALTGQTTRDTPPLPAGERLTPQPTKALAMPISLPSAGVSPSLNGHKELDHHDADAVESGSPPAPAIDQPAPKLPALVLADPLLALAADILDDIEGVRIVNENRLRQLTRDVADTDGEERGFGLTVDHPDVARLLAMVRALRCNTDFLLKELELPRNPERSGCCAEHDAERNLTKRIRAHPLGPWVKAAHGVGDKQGARLLATIGDPYWNDLHNRPRTVYELYAYCGFHVLPVSQADHGTQGRPADGDPTSGRQTTRDAHDECAAGTQPLADHAADGTHSRTVSEGPGGHSNQRVVKTQTADVGAAATRARGQRGNWSPTARMRAHLVAKSIVKAGGPYREVYDRGRVKYADAVHQVECRRCAPKGHPAPVGSPLSEGHKYARAVRLIAKAVLKDLWREARRLHWEAGALVPTGDG